jgi:hypothetical protein
LDITSLKYDNSTETIPLTSTGDILPRYEPGEELKFGTFITNEDVTGTVLGLDPNSCETTPETLTTDSVNGTLLEFVVEIPGVGTGSNTLCVPDKGILGGVSTTKYATVTMTLGDEFHTLYLPNFWWQLQDGTRVTKKYTIPIQTVEEGGTSDLAPDDGDAPSDDPDETYDPIDTGIDFEFDGLEQSDVTGSVSRRTINEGESFEMSVDIQAFLAPGEDSISVPIKFLIDNRVQGTDTGFISVNGANGGDLTVNGLEPGAHFVGYRVGDLPSVPLGEVEVNPVFDADRVNVTCSREVAEVAPGEEFDLAVSITNDNASAAEVAYDVLIGGDVAGSRTVTVDSHDKTDLTVPVVIDNAGEFSVSVEATASEA